VARNLQRPLIGAEKEHQAMTIRPRRSVLYMPGSNARALEKARELPADGLILDLEDAVAPEAKTQARDAIAKALQNGGFGDREVLVRINGLDTRWWVEDLNAIVAVKPDAVLVPKISNPAQLQDLAARIVDMGTDPHIRVWAMMETPLAMLNVGEIAASALDSETRLAGFVMGTNDLAKDTRARLVPGRAPMLPWLMNCVAAARAYGLDILDGVYNELGNAEGFAEECRQACDLGFDGKTLIHPKQIEPCNEAFSPSDDEVKTARKMIEAFDQPENENKGVIQIDGRMVERLHAEMARRTVAIADAIAKQQNGAQTAKAETASS
jgi:citrate lyase subunit beta / citryl-CoA lyase